MCNIHFKPAALDPRQMERLVALAAGLEPPPPPAADGGGGSGGDPAGDEDDDRHCWRPYVLQASARGRVCAMRGGTNRI